MAFTLAQLAKIEKQALKRGVMLNILRFCRIMETFPFENVSALDNIAVRWSSLPDVAFRKIGAGYTASEGDYDQIHESVYAFGGDINLDRIFGKVKNTIVDPRKDQVKMKTKAMAYKFNDYLINGDHATDADGFEGLKKRVAGMPSRQTVYVAAAASAAHVPITDATTARTFLDKWEEAYYKCNNGEVKTILCNEGIRWGFARVLRLAQIGGGGFLDVTRDSFDREILRYKNASIVDMGFKKDQATEIITDTEVAGDGGADATSAYFVSYGTDEGLSGIQLDQMEVYDPLNGGEQESIPAKLVRIEWIMGLANFGSHAFTRLRNFEGASQW
jgi:hypothetical protein